VDQVVPSAEPSSVQSCGSRPGASFADVVKLTHFLTNVEDRSLINPIRKEFLGETRPASTLVEVSRLVLPEFLLEIEAVALLP